MDHKYRVIHEQGKFRIIEVPDDHVDFDSLCGDSYSPKAHPDLAPEQLEQELQDFRDLVNREGVFGYVLERWDPRVGEGYVMVDSCFGFVGAYTPTEEVFNHYIVEELKAQIKGVDAIDK